MVVGVWIDEAGELDPAVTAAQQQTLAEQHVVATYDPAAGDRSGHAAQQLRLPVGWYEAIAAGSGAEFPISGDASQHYGS